MHTFRYDDNFRIHHHGGYDGEIILVNKNPPVNDGMNEYGHVFMHVPIDAVLEFVAKYVRSKLTEALDGAETDALLKLLPAVLASEERR